MTEHMTVIVSSRNQIAVPAEARRRLKIHSGDKLLVDIQDGMLVIMPQPKNYTKHLAGLYREVWEEVDTTTYLEQERSAWEA